MFRAVFTRTAVLLAPKRSLAKAVARKVSAPAPKSKVVVKANVKRGAVKPTKVPAAVIKPTASKKKFIVAVPKKSVAKRAVRSIKKAKAPQRAAKSKATGPVKATKPRVAEKKALVKAFVKKEFESGKSLADTAVVAAAFKIAEAAPAIVLEPMIAPVDLIITTISPVAVEAAAQTTGAMSATPASVSVGSSASTEAITIPQTEAVAPLLF